MPFRNGKGHFMKLPSCLLDLLVYWKIRNHTHTIINSGLFAGICFSGCDSLTHVGEFRYFMRAGGFLFLGRSENEMIGRLIY